MVGRILRCVLKSISPKPLSHSVAVGVYTKHAKGACANCIYNLALLDRKVLEIHERAHRNNYSHKSIRVGHKFVRNKLNAEIHMQVYNAQCTHHRHNNSQQCEQSPLTILYVREQTMHSNVRRHKIQDAEPCYVIEHNVYAWYCSQYRICEQAQCHKLHMLLFVQIVYQYIQERNEQVEDEET